MSATILVVEDDEEILSSVAEVIREEGFEAITAGNGYQALEVLDGNPIALVLLDLMMPHLSGWQFLDRLRARRPGVPVVLVSARNDLAHQASMLSVQGFLQKPFSLEDIVRITHQFCDAEP